MKVGVVAGLGLAFVTGGDGCQRRILSQDSNEPLLRRELKRFNVLSGNVSFQARLVAWVEVGEAR